MSDQHISNNKTPKGNRSSVDMDEEELQDEEEWQEERSDRNAGASSNGEVGYEADVLHPARSKKVWIILTGIFLVIAVAVLYVYQAGDTKTILGNQPIPQSPYAYGSPVAMTAPINGLPQQPIGNPPRENQNEVNRAAVVPPVPSQNTTNSQNLVRCPQCRSTGIPVCSSCGATMKPLPGSTNLFYCPSCGSVGTPVCPQCGTQMSSCTNSAHLAAAP